MCGITGFLDRRGVLDVSALNRIATLMADAIENRGPDDAASWSDSDAGIALGFRRLAIIDLSVEGRQPMTSSSGRYVIVFNGEIYNHHDIRREIGVSHPFRGGSDTETMLTAFERWGVFDSVRRFAGMFAFGVWDRRERALHLCRDRIGEKPLYYGWSGDVFMFASELKALRRHPEFQAEIHRDALIPYLRRGYIPGPSSIYRGIYKLTPGSHLTITAETPVGSIPEASTYWSARRIAETGQTDLFRGTESEAVDHLERLLGDVIAREIVADVPVGAFLSGGVDSSTIVALMRSRSSTPVRTFTIGFDETRYNEAEHAKAVARHLGTEHTELYVTARDTMDVLPKIPTLFDEPFADSSQIPTFLVAQLARRSVTVSLSGDGGDELFGGYERHFRPRSPWYAVAEWPTGIRKTAAGALCRIPSRAWDRAFGMANPLLPLRYRGVATGDRVHRVARLMAEAGSEAAVFDGLSSQWDSPRTLVLDASEPPNDISDPTAWAKLDDSAHRLMYIDTVSYLRDDILTKVDRATMGVSLESRAPFLDHEVVEFAWRLPKAMKIRDGKGKWVVRQLLARHVPSRLTERPKMGFSVPIDDWLRGSLRDWAETLLSEDRLRDDGIFDPIPIRARWEEHLSGRRNWKDSLWYVLVFQSWLDSQRRP